MVKVGKIRNNFIYVPEDPPQKPSLIPIVLLIGVWPVGTLIALYLAYKRGRSAMTRKKYQLYRRYANAIGARGAVSIRELATKTGVAASDVINDLQAMIDQGFIGGEAYIDRAQMMLYMDTNVVQTEFVNPTINIHVNTDAKTEARPVVEVDNRAKEASAPKPAEPEAPKPAPRKTGTENADFEAKLREIRQLNDEIDDDAVSRRIDRIGELTASIFRVVREKPEHAEEVRKFMNYYLPTTLKLLKSYALMEKQSYQGENIQASRKKIEEVLDTLIHAFEQQQDRLFRTEALDVETDISVLETMLRSDGLTEESGGLKLKAGGGH